MTIAPTTETVTCGPLPPIVAMTSRLPGLVPANKALVRPPWDGLTTRPRHLAPLGRAVGRGRERLDDARPAGRQRRDQLWPEHVPGRAPVGRIYVRGVRNR